MKVVHVAVGVILNSTLEILISKRSEGSHQGGLWEFPGGKVEPGESLQEALSRELEEELGIELEKCSSLMQVRHDYDDKSVLLDVCVVWAFKGQARGVEGQPLRWITVADIDQYPFPAANKPIIEAVKTLLENVQP